MGDKYNVVTLQTGNSPILAGVQLMPLFLNVEACTPEQREIIQNWTARHLPGLLADLMNLCEDHSIPISQELLDGQTEYFRQD